MRQKERRRCRDIMTKQVITVESDQSLHQAAQLMRDNDIGALPVVKDGKLVGIITDRDIVVRAIAENLSLQTKVEQVMTKEVFSVREDEFVFNAIRKMGEKQIRRLPVLDDDENLVGIISLADVALETEDDLEVIEALEEISSGRGFWQRR